MKRFRNWAAIIALGWASALSVPNAGAAAALFGRRKRTRQAKKVKG